MTDSLSQRIIINGDDKTDRIVSCRPHGDRVDVVFKSSSRVFSYASRNVQFAALRQTIDPDLVVFKHKGATIADAEQILDFGAVYVVVRTGGKTLSCEPGDVAISRNCLAEKKSGEMFRYYKDVADAVGLVTENGKNLLSLQYDKIKAVEDCTVLARFLHPTLPFVHVSAEGPLLFPFGLNQSQKTAVKNAFSSQISIIQGPPGTGKTQTILNIVANAVVRGMTVAVVSNNNSATRNVADKLKKSGLGFLAAFLGSLRNKAAFLEGQTRTYPRMSDWALSPEDKAKLEAETAALSGKLDSMLEMKNRTAQIEQELLDLAPEQFYFEQYSAGRTRTEIPALSKLSSEKIVSLWVEYEDMLEKDRRPGLFGRLSLLLRYNRGAPALFDKLSGDAVTNLQRLFYKSRKSELEKEKQALEKALKDYCFDAALEELEEKSMRLFKAEVYRRFGGSPVRQIFGERDFRGRSADFNAEYPVILSTTHSIKGTLSIEHIYDIVVVDEASQVDLATGVLAFSCARNIVIVGDRKQLPNVIPPEDALAADAVWAKHGLTDGRYCFTTHSMLAAASEIWPSAPSVLLREHYRCHPKIAGFFNKKFYSGELIVMTRDAGEEDVLSLYKTAKGNHARGHVNQRQIDVIREEILPALRKRGFKDIGIITPYRDQVAALAAQLGSECEVDTVHKFQGREKDAIVLTSVDNEIGEFVDDPNLLNVAVSRAVKSLSVVVSNSEANEKTNYGDLEKYIKYNNLQVIDSRVYSVFDLLYKGYRDRRAAFLKGKKRVSEYDSENLAYAVVCSVLKRDEFAGVGCAVRPALATLIKDAGILTDSEAAYALNPLTHIDFLLFNKMDKKPLLALEVDGTAFHATGSRQAERDTVKNAVLAKLGIPCLRIRTNESGETARIEAALRSALN